MRGDMCVAVAAISTGRDSHSGGCVIQQGRGHTCLWLWVNARVVGNGHRLVDAVLVAQVINVAVGVKKEKLSCDEVWWPSTQQKHAVVVLASTWMDAWIDADRGVVISAMGERVSKKYNLHDERMDTDNWKCRCW